MALFLAALTAFLLFHLVPAAPAIRGRLVATMGRSGYITAYSILSLVLMAWLVVAARQADDIVLWETQRWHYLTPFVLMPFALFLIISGLVQGTPLSLSLRIGADLPAIATVTRHPVLWGLLLWALAHLPPNGRLIPVLLFGAMAALAAMGFRRLDAKARLRMGPDRWSRVAGKTSILPFAAMLVRRTTPGAGRVLAVQASAAAVIYAWFVLYGHAWLIGPNLRHGLEAFL
ncbi:MULTISPECIES: NnrU family protein [Bosea]|jgi:uncharacterized membrane protein|uniref:NnrU family protein n=1 Tax=Bosea vaviloviae TaxID=1526658 RepID=A0A0N0MB27_9HYPH|nr:NnrU family protein [Bosea vaviloviae]KPH80398.1 NnrU family protein [Bosea vaviloviae]